MGDRTLGEWLGEAPFSLAMSSGFFSFFAHAGVLDVLVQRQLTPASVAGSSAGALVTGAWAAGVDPAELRRELVALRRDDFWDPSPGLGLLAGGRFDRLLRRMLPVTTLAGCRVPVAVSVFDIFSGKTTVLRDGDLPHAIRASCAVPGLFHPVWIAGRPYWDGGILDRPGLAGLPAGDRVLFHHISSQSPWRLRLSMPRRPGMITLCIDGLPRSGPFRLDAGHRAMQLAETAMRRALDAPIVDGVVRVNV